MNLDFTTLEKAIQRLAEAIEKYQKYQNDPEFSDSLRDSLVKRFEFTYEHSAKFLTKCLKEQGFYEISEKLKKTLFREAGKAGYIKDVEKWFEFQKSRNKTSHEYEEKFVDEDEYIKLIKDFHKEVQILLSKMKEKHNEA